jgi:hypothetical protein|tara:strand:+ start:160 stop:285 length:126 start_codon:yes stop_codon:yes gene_type:complete
MKGINLLEASHTTVIALLFSLEFLFVTTTSSSSFFFLIIII